MMKKEKYLKKSREGGVSIVLMLIAFSMSVLVGGYMKFSLNNLSLARRSIDYERARIFAESALDAAEVQISLAVEEHVLGLTTNLGLDTLTFPSFPQSQYDAAILKAKCASNTPSGFVKTNMYGLHKEYMDVIITAGVSNKITGVTASFRETVRLIAEPLDRSAIFYNGLLELHPGGNMTVTGDMVSNAGIKLWGGKNLNFNGRIRAKDGVVIYTADHDQETNDIAKRISVKVKNGTYESFFQDGKVLDSNNPAWNTQSMTVWGGRVLTGDRAGTVNLPIERTVDNHVLIEPPKATDSAKVRKTKLANKADLYIKVCADKTIKVGKSATDLKEISSFEIAQIAKNSDGKEIKTKEHGIYTIKQNGTNGCGWISVQTNFYDPRESEESYKSIVNGDGSGIKNQQMEMVNIYMDKLLQKHGSAKTVYIEVEKPASGGAKPAVRLRNGYNLTPNNEGVGLSIVSHCTGYVEGDFNSKSELPVLIAMDNLTVLSSKWRDAKSGKGSQTWNKDNKPGGGPVPKGGNIKFNACVMIGYADPDHLVGKEKTGGAHNLVRFREWLSGKKYEFKGSYISLWTSKSHALYQCDTFYKNPTRFIEYDQNFTKKQPPNMPVVYSTPLVVKWSEIPWNKATASN